VADQQGEPRPMPIPRRRRNVRRIGDVDTDRGRASSVQSLDAADPGVNADDSGLPGRRVRGGDPCSKKIRSARPADGEVTTMPW